MAATTVGLPVRSSGAVTKLRAKGYPCTPPFDAARATAFARGVGTGAEGGQPAGAKELRVLL